MKGKLYTMLRIKREYELSLFERVLWWMVEDAELDEYIRSVIELRDAGYIHEEDSDNAIYYRLRYITEKGYHFLPRLKRLYLKELWIKNRWTLIGWIIMFLLALLAVI